uniref:Uncharacterized protein n=1 Tax=Fagus sylvatica TaxID=28930 RepID=A0A2N9J6X9_FAGSY
MKRIPRDTARLAKEVTGIPTTPNMWSTPKWARDLAARRFPSMLSLDHSLGGILNEAKAGQSGEVQRATWPRSPPSRRHRGRATMEFEFAEASDNEVRACTSGIGSGVRATALIPDLARWLVRLIYCPPESVGLLGSRRFGVLMG